MDRPELPPITDSQEQAIRLAIQDVVALEMPEYQWLFALVGRLRAMTPGSRATDRRDAQQHLQAAVEFGRRVATVGRGTGAIDWLDEAAVELDFYKAWKSRRSPSGSSFLDIAVEASEHNFLGLPTTENQWVVRIANMAFCLSEMMPELPFMIPVSESTADRLGISLRTLSLALQEVIFMRFVTVQGSSADASANRRARRLRFNPKQKLIANDIGKARKRFREFLAKRGTRDGLMES